MEIFRRASRRAFVEREVSCWPFTSTVPEVGVSSRLMHRTRVDFPAPDRPMMPKISPFSTSRLTPSRALKGLPSTKKVFVMLSSLIMGGIRCLLSKIKKP